jgi:hypothetical protein
MGSAIAAGWVYKEAKCPVCEDFVGDEAAVNHHVERTHFKGW